MSATRPLHNTWTNQNKEKKLNKQRKGSQKIESNFYVAQTIKYGFSLNCMFVHYRVVYLAIFLLRMSDINKLLSKRLLLV